MSLTGLYSEPVIGLKETISPEKQKYIALKLKSLVENHGFLEGSRYGKTNFPSRRTNLSASDLRCDFVPREQEKLRLRNNEPSGDEEGYDGEPWFWYYTARYLHCRDKKEEGLIPAYARFYEDLEWRWDDDPFAEEIGELVTPLMYLFKKLTKVSVLVQIPGKGVPVHRDVTPGQWYEDLGGPNDPEYGSYAGYFEGRINKAEAYKYLPKTNTIKAQKYYQLRIPIMTGPNGDPGRMYVLLPDGRKYYYRNSNHCYLLQETVAHGAEACEWERGILHVSGIFNEGVLDEIQKHPIEFDGPY